MAEDKPNSSQAKYYSKRYIVPDEVEVNEPTLDIDNDMPTKEIETFRVSDIEMDNLYNEIAEDRYMPYTKEKFKSLVHNNLDKIDKVLYKANMPQEIELKDGRKIKTKNFIVKTGTKEIRGYEYKRYQEGYINKVKVGDKVYTKVMSDKEAERAEAEALDLRKPENQQLVKSYRKVLAEQREREDISDYITKGPKAMEHIKTDFWDNMGHQFYSLYVGAKTYYDEITKGVITKDTLDKKRNLKAWSVAYDEEISERDAIGKTIGKAAQITGKTVPVLPAVFLGGPPAMAIGGVSANLSRASQVTKFNKKNLGKIGFATSVGALNTILLNPFKYANIGKAVLADYAVDQIINTAQSYVETGKAPNLYDALESAYQNTIYVGLQIGRGYKMAKVAQFKNATELKTGGEPQRIFALNNEVIRSSEVPLAQKTTTLKSALDTDIDTNLKNMLIDEYNQRVNDDMKVDYIQPNKTRIQQEAETKAGITFEEVQQRLSQNKTDIGALIKNEELQTEINYKNMLKENYPSLLYGSKYNDADKVKLLNDLHNDPKSSFKMSEEERQYITKTYLDKINDGEKVQAEQDLAKNIDNPVIRDVILDNKTNSDYFKNLFFRNVKSQIPSKIDNLKYTDFKNNNNEKLVDIFLNTEEKRVSLENNKNEIMNKKNITDKDIGYLKSIGEEIYQKYTPENNKTTKAYNAILRSDNPNTINRGIDFLIKQTNELADKASQMKFKYILDNTTLGSYDFIGKGFRKFKNNFRFTKPLDVKNITNRMIDENINTPMAYKLKSLQGKKFSDLDYQEKNILSNSVKFLNEIKKATLEATELNTQKQVMRLRNAMLKNVKEQRKNGLIHKIAVGLRDVPALGGLTYKAFLKPDTILKIVDGGDGPFSKTYDNRILPSLNTASKAKKSLMETAQNELKLQHYDIIRGEAPDTKVSFTFDSDNKSTTIPLGELASIYVTYKATDGKAYLLGQDKRGNDIGLSKRKKGVRIKSEKYTHRQITDTDIKNIEKTLNEYGLGNIDEKFFNIAKEAIVYMQEGKASVGDELPEVNKYIHIEHSRLDLDLIDDVKLNDADIEMYLKDISTDLLRRKSATKQRKTYAPVKIDSLWYKMQRMIEDAGDIYGKTKTAYIWKNLFTKELKQEMEKTFGTKMTEELVGGKNNNPFMARYEKGNITLDLFNKWGNRRLANYARGVLSINPTTPFKQIPSYLMAYNEGVDYKYLSSGWKKTANNTGISSKQVQEIVPMLWERFYRYQVNKAIALAKESTFFKNNTNVLKRLGSQTKSNIFKATEKGMVPIIESDKLAITSLVNAISDKILDENPNMEFGSNRWQSELKQQATEIISKTQPMWHEALRTELASSKNVLANAFTMFHTARTQAVNNLIRNVLDFTAKDTKTTQDYIDISKKFVNYFANKGVLTSIDMLSAKALQRDDDEFWENYKKNVRGELPIVAPFAEIIEKSYKGEYANLNLPMTRAIDELTNTIRSGKKAITGVSGDEVLPKGDLKDLTDAGRFLNENINTRTKEAFKAFDNLMSLTGKLTGTPYTGSKKIFELFRIISDDKYRNIKSVQKKIKKEQDKDKRRVRKILMEALDEREKSEEN